MSIFTIAANRYNRDPGELTFHTVPVGFSLGWLSDRLELFAAFDSVKRVKPNWQEYNAPRSLAVYREIPGDLLSPAQTPQGQVLFNNEAPFIDVPVATDRGDIRWGAKFSLLTERKEHPLALAIAGFMTVPTDSSIEYLNRGLGTGEISAGIGALISKRAGDAAEVHFNAMLEFVRDPEVNVTPVANLQDAFVYRGGVGFPAYSSFQVKAEADGKLYYGSRTPGLNPKSPVDLIFGIRAYPHDWMSLGFGYRASVNHVDEQEARDIYPAG